jgi:hypothetical protein
VFVIRRAESIWRRKGREGEEWKCMGVGVGV